jgi:hypothetical protein
MNEYDHTQVSPEIVSAADEHAASVNGSHATTPQIAATDKPEVLLGAAFAGGFLLAKILRRLAG